MDENLSRAMVRRISLAALPAFEAAARRGSFRDAAAELHVTPSAVSHQMRGLEEQLGVRLFARSVRRVSLTAEGRALLEATTRAFDQLEEGLRAIASPGEQSVTATVTPAFATRWLIPRLGRFQDRHPDIRVQLVTTTEVSPLSGDIDLAVRYGRGSLPGHRYHLVALPAQLRRPPVAAFATWLREEARRKPAG